jgi:GTP-binding protein
VELPDFRRFVVADIPGLIEGAHEGVGLGDAFLRHIERTRVIAHLVDLCPPEGCPTPFEAYQTVRRELASYSAALVSRPEIVVANKMDLTGSEEALAELSKALGSSPRAISGVTGRGIRELAETMWTVVEEARQEQTAAPERIDFGEGVDRLESGDDDARDADSTRPGEQQQ